MSWSLSVPKTGVADFAATAAKACDDYRAGLAENDYQLDPAAVEAMTKAAEVAKAIVDSGIVGTGTVTASLSGHANPGHQPTSGWANDFVTVSVYCADEYQAPAAADGGVSS